MQAEPSGISGKSTLATLKAAFKVRQALRHLVYVILIEKSSKDLKLSVYSESLELVDSDSFNDSYTLNFNLQALAKKHRIGKTVLVIHDKDQNTVQLSLGQEENLFFAS